MLTPYWRDRAGDLKTMLHRLAQLSTEDECRVSVVEIANSGNIHLQVLRPTLTQPGDDWSVSKEQRGQLYFYEKIYEGHHPDAAEIERAFRILLAAKSRNAVH